MSTVHEDHFQLPSAVALRGQCARRAERREMAGYTASLNPWLACCVAIRNAAEAGAYEALVGSLPLVAIVELRRLGYVVSDAFGGSVVSWGGAEHR